MNDSYIDDRKLHEECGVFGAYDFDCGDVASTIYYGLFALQHRGQESCGIAVSDTEGPKGKVLSHKDMGLVNEVFNSENLEKLKGNIGVGHVRYSTAGSSTRENAQPLGEDEYYIADLIGMEVYLEDGSHFGTLKDVMETGANDVYIIKTEEGKEVLIPAIYECILDVDVEAGKMEIHLLDGLV